VVLTAAAATGIGGSDGATYALGESDQELAAQTVALIQNAERARDLGLAARRFVIDGLSWDATLAPLAGMLGLAGPAERHAA
jgi:hypothetical protein